MEIVKTKLLDYKDIYKYTSIYQVVYNQIYDFIIKDWKLFTKKAGIFLQAIMFFNISNKYIKIILIIE